MPNYDYHAVFAVCELGMTMVQMAQLSGKAVIVKADFTALAPDTEHRVVIKKYG